MFCSLLMNQEVSTIINILQLVKVVLLEDLLRKRFIWFNDAKTVIDRN